MSAGGSAAGPLALTAAAMVAFAANSVLCRMALGAELVDPYSFTAVRLGSGALTLLALTTLRKRPKREKAGSWKAAGLLILYALPFSLAYVQLDTGTGALLMFGAVQLTMIGHGLWSGERPGVLEWVALVAAAGGIVYLVSPGVTAPDPLGAAAMAAAGFGWGVYSVLGKGSRDPAATTSANFQRAAVVLVPATAIGWPWLSFSTEGVLLALLSGTICSGLGYVVWYAALVFLTSTRAALVQLSVPVLAAAGGVALMSEEITFRLVSSGVVILGAIALGAMQRANKREPTQAPDDVAQK